MKIAIIRNPIKRLLSGWEDKFERKCLMDCQHIQVRSHLGTFYFFLNFFFVLLIHFQSFFGPVIVQETRKNASQEEIAQGCPNFDEFVRFASKVPNYSLKSYENLIRQFQRWKKCQFAVNSANHWYSLKSIIDLSFPFFPGDQSPNFASHVEFSKFIQQMNKTTNILFYLTVTIIFSISKLSVVIWK